MPSDRLRDCTCALSYSSIRLPGEPSCEEASRLLIRPAFVERPRCVPAELIETLSISSTVEGDTLGLLVEAVPPEACRWSSENPCCVGGEGNEGWSIKVAFWEASGGADCIKGSEEELERRSRLNQGVGQSTVRYAVAVEEEYRVNRRSWKNGA